MVKCRTRDLRVNGSSPGGGRSLVFLQVLWQVVAESLHEDNLFVECASFSFQSVSCFCAYVRQVMVIVSLRYFRN